MTRASCLACLRSSGKNEAAMNNFLALQKLQKLAV
jgi:hypothetical protein